MSEFSQALLLVGVYRLAVLFVGLAFGVMGYRLFVAGVYGNSGDFQAMSGKLKLILKNGAPGVFFALFGMIIVGQSVWRGIDIDRAQQPALIAKSRPVPPSAAVPPTGMSPAASAAGPRTTPGAVDPSQPTGYFVFGGEPPTLLPALEKAARGERLNDD